MGGHKLIDRRAFIALLLGGAGILLLDRFTSNQSKWDFLNAKAPSLEEAIASVPLHKEYPIDKSTNEYTQLVQENHDLITKAVQKFSDIRRYSVEIKKQRYGVPENEHIVRQLLEYCKLAESYLYTRLDITPKPVDWTIIKKGDDFSENYNKKGMLGGSVNEITRFYITDIDAPENILALTKSMNSEQSFIFTESDKHGLMSWCIFVGSGKKAITSPFAELIPLLVYDASKRLILESGIDAAILAGEALSEGISYFLALELSKELQIPNGVNIVQETFSNFNKGRYSYVPKAIKWIERNGVQAALDLYLKNPKSFIDAMAKIR